MTASTILDKNLSHPLKLGILVSHPIQYFVPVYRELAKNSTIDLQVIYRTRVGVDTYFDPGFGQSVQWDIPLMDGYPSEFLSKKTKLNGFEIKILPAILRNRFDVLIVHGYSSLTNLLAIVLSKLVGTRVIVRGDTRLQARHKNAPSRKTVLKRAIFKLFDGFLTIGSLNRDYYTSFGAASCNIFFAPFCVDNAVFCLDENGHKKARLASRDRWGISPESVVVLFASKFIERKRAADLISAFSRVIKSQTNSCLVFAGSGPDEAELRDLANQLCPGRARFIGFQNQTELPSLYAASDIFVLPSEEEPWGLVVNEVMAAGLPVVVTDEVGAAPDLVEGKNTGIVYPCGDIDALASALEMMICSESTRLEMGRNAKKLIADWNIDSCVQGILRAVDSVRGK